MRLGPKVLTAVSLLAVAVGASGCGGGAAASSAGMTLTVYSSLPLSSGSHLWASSIVNGEKLALEQAGGQVGSFKVAFVSLDDSLPATGRWDPGQTSANARTAAQDKSTIAFLGDWDSGATAISLPLINGAGILQISPGASYPGLTRSDYGGKGEPDRYYPSGRRTFGRLVAPDQVQAAAQLAYMHAVGVRTLYVLTDRDVFASAVGTITAAHGLARGVRVLGSEGLGASDSDLRAAVARAAASGADAVLFAVPAGARADMALRGLHAQAPGVKLFLPFQSAEPDLLAGLGPVARALYVTTPALDPRLYDPQGQSFVRAFRAKFAAPPGPWAAYGYESMRVVLDAIRAAGARGNDRQSVIDRFLATQNRSSPLGTYSIEANGDTTLARYAGARPRGGEVLGDRQLRLRPLGAP